MFMGEFLLGGAVCLQFYRGLVGKAIYLLTAKSPSQRTRVRCVWVTQRTVCCDAKKRIARSPGPFFLRTQTDLPPAVSQFRRANTAANCPLPRTAHRRDPAQRPGRRAQ